MFPDINKIRGTLVDYKYYATLRAQSAADAAYNKSRADAIGKELIEQIPSLLYELEKYRLMCMQQKPPTTI